MNRCKYTYLHTTNPFPDKHFCLKFCRLDGKVVDESNFNFSVFDLILYLGLYLGFIKVFGIYKK